MYMADIKTEQTSAEQNASLLAMMLSMMDRLFTPNEPKLNEPEIVITDFKRAGYEDDLERVEGDGISYGAAVKIDINNIHSLGLDDDPQILKMDENGQFHEPEDIPQDPNIPADSVLNIQSPEMFLNSVSVEGDSKMSHQIDASGNPVYNGLEDASFHIRRVEYNGETTGYLVSPHEDGAFGYYLGPDAIDYAGLPEDMRNTLSTPEPESPPENPHAPNALKAENTPSQNLNALQPL